MLQRRNLATQPSDQAEQAPSHCGVSWRSERTTGGAPDASAQRSSQIFRLVEWQWVAWVDCNRVLKSAYTSGWLHAKDIIKRHVYSRSDKYMQYHRVLGSFYIQRHNLSFHSQSLDIEILLYLIKKCLPVYCWIGRHAGNANIRRTQGFTKRGMHLGAYYIL